MKNRNVPNGKPLLLYTLPQLYGAVNHLCTVDADRLDAAEALCRIDNVKCDETILELCDNILEENHIEKPATIVELRDVYIYFRNRIRTML